jgi:hypothetical protein
MQVTALLTSPHRSRSRLPHRQDGVFLRDWLSRARSETPCASGSIPAERTVHFCVPHATKRLTRTTAAHPPRHRREHFHSCRGRDLIAKVLDFDW